MSTTKLVRTKNEVRKIRWADPKLSWGLVPTMGALHEGHLSLVRKAKEANDCVGVSIFVNPTQFDRSDDLERYPRQLEQDLAMLEAEGVDLVWSPPVEEVYPAGDQTTVTVSEITQLLEGAHRPGHFRGVTTVVAKLLNVFEPTRAYFGQKDAQQVAVIQQMVRDLAFNVEVVPCPILREPDGLAFSSRNALLRPEERAAATILYRSLLVAKSMWEAGQREADDLRNTMRTLLESEPLARIDYVSLAHPVTLEEIEGVVTSALVSLAVYIGHVRLIDNIVLNP